MADDPAPLRDVTVPSDGFRALAESAGLKLKERLLGRRDSATKTYGFDLYETQLYLDVLDPLMNHEELRERHSGGKLHKLKICVSTKTIKHDRTTIGNVNPFESNRKVVWLLAVFANEEEKDKIGRSFSLDTRFNLVEEEIFLSYKVE